MPMKEDNLFGLNKDNSKNLEYCIYCFKDGDFIKPNETFEEMVDTCIPFLEKEGMSKDEAKNHLEKTLKNLKRWK
jgi:hypothetical protein